MTRHLVQTPSGLRPETNTEVAIRYAVMVPIGVLLIVAGWIFGRRP